MFGFFCYNFGTRPKNAKFLYFLNPYTGSDLRQGKFQKLVTSCDHIAQPAKVDLNKKSFPKQKTIQNITIDAQGFRKTKNENPSTLEMGVTS